MMKMVMFLLMLLLLLLQMMVFVVFATTTTDIKAGTFTGDGGGKLVHDVTTTDDGFHGWRRRRA